MNRRNFFKNLTAAVIGVIVAPVVVVKAVSDVRVYKSPIMKDVNGKQIFTGKFSKHDPYHFQFSEETIKLLYKKYGNMSAPELFRIGMD